MVLGKFLSGLQRKLNQNPSNNAPDGFRHQGATRRTSCPHCHCNVQAKNMFPIWSSSYLIFNLGECHFMTSGSTCPDRKCWYVELCTRPPGRSRNQAQSPLPPLIRWQHNTSLKTTTTILQIGQCWLNTIEHYWTLLFKGFYGFLGF